MGGKREFETRGLNHLALVCSDMQRTVDFYEGVLGFPLVKTVELPTSKGQHFFFDIGNGASIAFFWFPDAAPAAPGISCQHPETKRSGIASMNHVAIDVPLDQIEDIHRRLLEKGIEATPIVNHDDSDRGASPEMHPGVFVRSIYFSDPDGILLEFAAWARDFTPADVAHTPASAEPAGEQLARSGRAS